VIGSTEPFTEQSISLQDNVVASFTSGSIFSPRIGPAQTWETLSYNIGDLASDNTRLDLVGINRDGEKTTLFSQARTESVDVSTVDPVVYPQLELSFLFSDEQEQTPPQLNFWQVNYIPTADALLVPVNKVPISIPEGQEINVAFNAINVSDFAFTDSLSVMASFINQTTGALMQNSKKITAPTAQDTINFTLSFSSLNMAGSNSLVVEIAANENETYTTNNRVTQANLIEVQPDETNPIIDVTFDGFHILNGDVVSPNPVISVRMRDDNSLLFKTDTTGFNISLRSPGEGQDFERINFSDPRLQFVPAAEGQDFEVELQPGPLEDGTYSMRILAEDESGNEIRAIDDPYEISFEVVNESTITHFYPYPNPFSTRCQFVFTLTGSTIPSQLKIQILTVSGRVVREITQDEIGPIRIGNNITSYAWDGRDQYGDQLANGVYFYKVIFGGEARNIAQRFTAGDRAFKNGFGKLYILR
ncbi:MAG: transporter, partial [Bacteroidota bacterium]